MDAEFWREVGQQVGITGVGLGIGGYILKRWLVNNMAVDAAKESALQIKDEIIKQLRQERRESDAEWQLRWDRREKDFLEFKRSVERDQRIQRTVTKAMSNDIKTIAALGANTIPPERLETQILITGMGPLDR